MRILEYECVELCITVNLFFNHQPSAAPTRLPTYAPSFIPTSSPTVDPEVSSSDLRRFGSSGYYVKVWNYNDYVNNRVGTHSNAKMQFPVRDSLYFSFIGSFQDRHPYYWPSALRYYSESSDGYYFHADAGTVFVAPLSANYSFYTTADDQSYLYVSRKNINVEEKLIAQCTCTPLFRHFWSNLCHFFPILVIC